MMKNKRNYPAGKERSIAKLILEQRILRIVIDKGSIEISDISELKHLVAGEEASIDGFNISNKLTVQAISDLRKRRAIKTSGLPPEEQSRTPYHRRMTLSRTNISEPILIAIGEECEEMFLKETPAGW